MRILAQFSQVPLFPWCLSMKFCLLQQIFEALKQLFLVFHPAFLVVLSKSTSQIPAILSKPETIYQSNTLVFLKFILFIIFSKFSEGQNTFYFKTYHLFSYLNDFGEVLLLLKLVHWEAKLYRIWIVESSYKIYLAFFSSWFQELIYHLHITNVHNINWIPILPDGTCSHSFETYLYTCIFFST